MPGDNVRDQFQLQRQQIPVMDRVFGVPTVVVVIVPDDPIPIEINQLGAALLLLLPTPVVTFLVRQDEAPDLVSPAFDAHVGLRKPIRTQLANRLVLDVVVVPVVIEFLLLVPAAAVVVCVCGRFFFFFFFFERRL